MTDQIDTFTEKGVRLQSGAELEADVIITATGFNMNVLGDIAFSVDGSPVEAPEIVTYRGIMWSGVPNMAVVFGYLRTSWTMRSDMISDFVCRLLAHMDDQGAHVVTPTVQPADETMPRLPWVDPENFNPGYITRALDILPKQGDRDPWRFENDYYVERDILPKIDLDEPELVYS